MAGLNNGEKAGLGPGSEAKPLLWFSGGTEPRSENSGSGADVHSGSRDLWAVMGLNIYK